MTVCFFIRVFALILSHLQANRYEHGGTAYKTGFEYKLRIKSVDLFC